MLPVGDGRLIFVRATSGPNSFLLADHRVAGSSPAGCKSSAIADLQAILRSRKASFRAITCQSFATFEANPLRDSLLCVQIGLLDTSQLWLIVKEYQSDEPHGLRLLISNC